MVSFPSGSTPMTRHSGRVSLTAAASPPASPPPPIGTITASRSGAWRSSSRPRAAGPRAVRGVRVAAGRPPPGDPAAADRYDYRVEVGGLAEQLPAQGRGAQRGAGALEGMDEAPALFALDPAGLREGCVNVPGQHDLGAERPAAGHPIGIGGFRHDHLGRRAEAARRPGDGDGVVAGAHGGHPARQDRGVEREHDRKRAPRLEAPGVLEELELEHRPGGFGEQPLDELVAPGPGGRLPDARRECPRRRIHFGKRERVVSHAASVWPHLGRRVSLVGWRAWASEEWRTTCKRDASSSRRSWRFSLSAGAPDTTGATRRSRRTSPRWSGSRTTT